MSFKIRNWDDLLKAVLSVSLVIIIVFMLVGYIDWKTAIDIIKQKIFP
jgi:uncharacterized membrane protein YbhN (UPF0104 family)